jgi:hypothetical protein
VIDDGSVLGDDDLVFGDEAAGGGAGWLHKALPVAAGFGSAYGLCGFGGADGLCFVSGRVSFGEEGEDGGFEGCVGGAGLVAAAGVAAVLDDVPVLGPLLAPLEDMAAGLADLVSVGSGAFGFGFAVGHGRLNCDASWCSMRSSYPGGSGRGAFGSVPREFVPAKLVCLSCEVQALVEVVKVFRTGRIFCFFRLAGGILQRHLRDA